MPLHGERERGLLPPSFPPNSIDDVTYFFRGEKSTGRMKETKQLTVFHFRDNFHRRPRVRYSFRKWMKAAKNKVGIAHRHAPILMIHFKLFWGKFLGSEGMYGTIELSPMYYVTSAKVILYKGCRRPERRSWKLKNKIERNEKEKDSFCFIQPAGIPTYLLKDHRQLYWILRCHSF